MTQPTIAAEIHQPLNIHGDLAPKIAFDDVVTIDHFANLEHFLVGQLRHATFLRNRHLLHDFAGLFGPDPVDVLERDDHALVSGYVDTGNTGHGLNSCCRLGK